MNGYISYVNERAVTNEWNRLVNEVRNKEGRLGVDHVDVTQFTWSDLRDYGARLDSYLRDKTEEAEAADANEDFSKPIRYNNESGK